MPAMRRKNFNDPETASSSGMSHVPSQSSRIPSPRGMLSRDSGVPHYSRNSMDTSGSVFESLPAQRKDISVFFPCSKKNLVLRHRPAEHRFLMCLQTPTLRRCVLSRQACLFFTLSSTLLRRRFSPLSRHRQTPIDLSILVLISFTRHRPAVLFILTGSMLRRHFLRAVAALVLVVAATHRPVVAVYFASGGYGAPARRSAPWCPLSLHVPAVHSSDELRWKTVSVLRLPMCSSCRRPYESSCEAIPNLLGRKEPLRSYICPKRCTRDIPWEFGRLLLFFITVCFTGARKGHRP